MSLQYTSHLAQKASLAYALIGGYALIAVSIIFGLSRQKNLMQDVDLQIGSWSEVSKTLLAVSFCIYLCTFLVFTNWAYRLIFLAPALLVLSPKEVAQKTSLVGKMAYWNIFAALWIPILPYGWALQNLVCYVLVVPTAVLTARIFRTWTTHKTKNAEASVDELPVEVKPLPPVSSYQTRSTSAVI
jgi:hypothetical protein